MTNYKSACILLLAISTIHPMNEQESPIENRSSNPSVGSDVSCVKQSTTEQSGLLKLLNQLKKIVEKIQDLKNNHSKYLKIAECFPTKYYEKREYPASSPNEETSDALHEANENIRAMTQNNYVPRFSNDYEIDPNCPFIDLYDVSREQYREACKKREEAIKMMHFIEVERAKLAKDSEENEKSHPTSAKDSEEKEESYRIAKEKRDDSFEYVEIAKNKYKEIFSEVQEQVMDYNGSAKDYKLVCRIINRYFVKLSDTFNKRRNLIQDPRNLLEARSLIEFISANRPLEDLDIDFSDSQEIIYDIFSQIKRNLLPSKTSESYLFEAFVDIGKVKDLKEMKTVLDKTKKAFNSFKEEVSKGSLTKSDTDQISSSEELLDMSITLFDIMIKRRENLRFMTSLVIHNNLDGINISNLNSHIHKFLF